MLFRLSGGSLLSAPLDLPASRYAYPFLVYTIIAGTTSLFHHAFRTLPLPLRLTVTVIVTTLSIHVCILCRLVHILPLYVSICRFSASTTPLRPCPLLLAHHLCGI